MSLIKINWRPNPKELRSFGKGGLFVSIIISLVLYFFKDIGIQWALMLISVGFIIFLTSLISVKLTRIIYLGLMLLTFPIGTTVSFLVLTSFYFLLLTPLGLFFRLIGRDPLRRKIDSSSQSYWLNWKSPDDLNRYFRQF